MFGLFTKKKQAPFSNDTIIEVRGIYEINHLVTVEQNEMPPEITVSSYNKATALCGATDWLQRDPEQYQHFIFDDQKPSAVNICTACKNNTQQ